MVLVTESQFLDMNQVVAEFYWYALILTWQQLEANQSGS